MMQNKKYFGMTTTQLGILGGLAGFACLLFAVAGFLVLRGGPGASPAPVAQNTPTREATVTPLVLPTITPTITPTPIPYEFLIPQGWAQFKTPLIEIWLPKGFKKANPSAIFKTSPDSPTVIELALQDMTSKKAVYRAIAGVQYEPITAESLEAFLDRELPRITPGYRVTERRKTLVNSVEATRILLEFKQGSVDGIELVYAIQDGGIVWYVIYGAEINQFYQMLDTFEQSAKTFRIVR